MDFNENKDKQTVFKENEETEEKTENENKATSIGLEQNIAGALCYLFGFITGIIFLLIEKENHFVKYHVIQSIVVWVILFILSIVLSVLPIIGWAIGLLITPLYLVLWGYMMWKAYQNTWFKLPISGDIAEKQLEKLD